MKGCAPFGAGAVLLSAAIAASVAACQASVAPTTTPGQPSASIDAATCRQLIMAANLADPLTIQAVDACRFRQEGATASKDVLTAGGTADQLWAAIWVYSSIGTDPAPIRPLAANSDPTLRAMASATLIADGDRSGFAPLTALLTSTDQLRGSDPPQTIGAFAVDTFNNYVSAATVPTPNGSSDPGTEVPAWTGWLAANESALQFSAADGQWKLP